MKYYIFIVLDFYFSSVTSYMNEHGLTPEEVSQQLRKMVECETGLTVSTGIAPNKTLAKVCRKICICLFDKYRYVQIRWDGSFCVGAFLTM